VQAAGLVLARVAPVLCLQAERVNFTLDAKAPVADQVEAVPQAVSESKVAPDVGFLFICLPDAALKPRRWGRGLSWPAARR
jgi:hypothetical protein